MRRALPIALAFVVLAVGRLDAQVLGDDARRAGVEMKSPTTARIVGIVPGAGHMYAGEVGRGFAYLGGTLGILVVGTAALVADCVTDFYGAEDCDSGSGEAIVTAVALGFWGWSIYDAGNAARRTNARRGARTALIVAPQRRPAGGGGGGRGGVRVGMSLVVR